MLTECSIVGCNNKVVCKGFCMKHYCENKYGRKTKERRNRTGNVAKHPEMWWTLNNAKQRCNNPDHPFYKYYGAIGIKVCDRWSGKDGLKNFIEDMGERPDGFSLDRIDVDGNYCPENCRWADKVTQSLNRHVKKKYSNYRGVTFDKKGGRWMAYLCVNKKNHTRAASSEEEAFRKRLELEAEVLDKSQ